jgi:Protein of unknown function (DUF2946)
VTSNSELRSRRRHGPLTRVLAFLLFALILHGATAEVVHKHGGLARGIVNTTTPSASDPGETDSSSQQTLQRNECAVCQLHQNLSNTLFSALPWTAPPPAQFTLFQARSIPYLSAVNTPRRGRAPPPAFLL